MLLQLKHFEVFRAVLRTRSTTEAADLLRLSQPAVSKLLKELEQQLGIQLFDRISGRLRVRPEADVMIAAVERVFLELESVHLLADNLRDPARLRMRIGGLTTFTSTLIPLAVARFHERHRDVPIEIHSLQADAVVERVASGRLDVGVIQSGGDHSMVETVAAHQTEVVCALPPGHPLEGIEKVRLAALRGYPLICYHLTEPSTLLIAETFRDVGETLSPAAVVSNSEAAIALVERGFGVAIITPMVFSTGRHGHLRFARLQPRMQLTLRVVKAKRRSLDPVMEEAVEEICRASQELVGNRVEEGR